MARAKRDDASAALFRVPPAEFVAARRRLVTELRAAKRDADAKAAARLRKPTVALWAANQAAHTNRHAVDALLDAVRRLKQAHLGRGDLRGAIDAQRTALDGLTASAREQLGAIAHAATPEIVARVSATLLASAVDPGAHDALRAGQLTGERPAPGFEAFGAGAVKAPPRAAAEPRPRQAKAAPPVKGKVVAIDEARLALQHAAEAERAERERRRREAADEAARRARELGTQAERERAAVAEAEAAEAALRRPLDEARRRTVAARRSAGQATRAARRARPRAK